MRDDDTQDQDTQVHTDSKGDVMQNGVPVHASDEDVHEEATRLPNSGRQFSETAAASHGGAADAPKHDHGVGTGDDAAT